MARLMVIPIKEKGAAVLIVTHHAGVVLMGYVTVATLAALLGNAMTPCECVAFIERHLQTLEQILLRKSASAAFVDISIACVEVEAADLLDSDIGELRRN